MIVTSSVSESFTYLTITIEIWPVQVAIFGPSSYNLITAGNSTRVTTTSASSKDRAP